MATSCKKWACLKDVCHHKFSDEAADAIAAVILLACVVTGIVYWLHSFAY